MKIACCTLEMITLIFLLVVSLNGGFTYVQDHADYTNRPAEELVSAWGEPDAIVVAADVGFASAQMDDVEVWSYENTGRSVIVRSGTVIAVREG
jgi:hypothetical protein